MDQRARKSTKVSSCRCSRRKRKLLRSRRFFGKSSNIRYFHKYRRNHNNKKSIRWRKSHTCTADYCNRIITEYPKLSSAPEVPIVSLAEHSRVPCYDVLEQHLKDPVLYFSVTLTFLICQSLTKNSFILLVTTFSIFYWIINRHIESFRSFRCVRNSVSTLSYNDELRHHFLVALLGLSDSQCPYLSSTTKDTTLDDQEASTRSFDWLNIIVANFWPYLSHVVHYELDEFLKDQIDSGSFANSDKSFRQLFFALLEQLDTNILIVEHCQLGSSAPFIQDIVVFTSESICPENPASVPAKSISIDIDFRYSGDMNITLVYKYFLCCITRLGLKDVYLHSKARIKLGPIKNELPVVDSISFTLLELPDFGYKGIALVELAELKLARKAINKLISDNILYPRSISLDIKKIYERVAHGPRPATRKHFVGDEPHRVPLWTRVMARLMLCSCLCSNCCLRCCQRHESPRTQNESEQRGEPLDL